MARRLKAGKRVLADDKFTMLDGEWNNEDINHYGHRLYGITPMDIYVHYSDGPLSMKEEVPQNICDRRFPSRPVMLNNRDKHHLALAGGLYSYHTNPQNMADLYGYIVQKYNAFARKFNIFYGPQIETEKVKKAKTVKKGRIAFYIHSFSTISPSGSRCLWKVTVKTKDEDGNPVRVALLAEIDGYDAANFPYDEVLYVADTMAIDECTMTRKVVNSMVCQLSPLAK